MLLLWNSYYFDLNIELCLWYIPELNKLYIDLWSVIILFATGIFEHHWKIKIECVQLHTWLLSLDNEFSIFCHQDESLKLHQTWQHLWLSSEDPFFVCAQ